MVRVSNNLQQHGATLLLCAALAGCSSSGDSDEPKGVLRANLIQFPQLYSAFDNGAHTYQLTPSIPAAADNSMDSDPIDAATIKWEVDGNYLSQAPFSDLPGGVLLTTKKAGMTIIKVTAKSKSGVDVRGEAPVQISQASPEEWDAGEARYNNGMAVNWQMLRPMQTTDGSTNCGLPVDLTGTIPTSSACTNCHNSMNPISIEHTPTQTAGYSDDALVQIFTQGQKPAGGVFNSTFLKTLPMPDCIYKSFHTWEIDEATKKGIVWKLRSIAPKVQPAIDFGRLAMDFAARRAAMGGAAGAPSP